MHRPAVLMIITLLGVINCDRLRAQAYREPDGGWLSRYEGDGVPVSITGSSGVRTGLDVDGDGGPDLTSDNGFDEWDLSGYLPGDGNPGGAMSLTVDGSTFLRLVDPGNPADHGVTDPSNRKIKLARSLALTGDPLDFFDIDAAENLGVTMYLRMRLVPGGELDGIQVLPDASCNPDEWVGDLCGATPANWPSEGKGQSEIRLDGTGFIGIDTSFASISFGMDYAANSSFYETDGLFMNSLLPPDDFLGPLPGSSDTSSAADRNGDGAPDAVLNVHPLENLTDWHDVWITLEPLDLDDSSIMGTHRVTVYTDGAIDGAVYEITAGTANVDDRGNPEPVIHFGPSYSSGFSAHDLDFFYVKQGVSPPELAVPGVIGDFNQDGAIGVDDVNLLSSLVASGGGDQNFDLNGDLRVDSADVVTLLGLAKRLNGDADFNGQVQFPDFVILASSFGQTGKKWSEGDFDSTGGVQFPDFVLFASSFGQSAPQDGVRGDFNNDGLVGVMDVDLLSAEVAREGGDASFDLTGDGNVNQADLDSLLGIANRLNGDADFNGQIQFPDFVILASSFGQTGKKWSEGDFDSTGGVQFPDFVLFAGNFGKSAAAAVVPEPAGEVLASLSLTVVLAARRRRRSRRPSARGISIADWVGLTRRGLDRNLCQLVPQIGA